MRLSIGPITIETRATKGAGSGIANPSQWVMDFLGAAKSVTGLDVHESTAMAANAVYQAISRTPGMNIVRSNDDDLVDRLKKGRITALIDIRRKEDSAGKPPR